jgi:hypothetical protein
MYLKSELLLILRTGGSINLKWKYMRLTKASYSTTKKADSVDSGKGCTQVVGA